ncbi:DUF917 domain-containing protein [Microbacterium paraoxydans]|uniref:DUF917 domain-containing protein n=1 Tax=Microbacterium paraoxydans TaxID=199592 RepID=UPI000468C14D|nr:DUF917 family protein [Microbacterium paraoxydans]
MAARQLTRTDALNAVYGGCILGGGGGGVLEEGIEKVDALFEHYEGPVLVSPDELEEDAYVACVALVGAPSASDAHYDADQLIDTVRMVSDTLDAPLAAIMTNENGAGTTTNGWLQAAALGLPVIDAPANGRAHPTGSMGSMNLHELDGYESVQAFAGGRGAQRVAGFIKARLRLAADAARAVSVQAGGLVTVCRNPVQVGYVAEHAAVGGISQAIELGAAYHAASEGRARIDAVVEFLGGSIVVEGVVERCELDQIGGFDVGAIELGGAEMTFWNEYMTLEIDGERLGTFPDLIMTLDSRTGAPVVTARVAVGQELTVIHVDRDRLLLSTTMSNAELLRSIEPIINKPILSV